MARARTARSTVHSGFTLIELLIVISIIGILSRLLFANYGELRERGRDSTRKSALQQVRNALRLYYNDYQRYPGASNGKIAGCGAASPPSSVCEWGNAFASSSTSYMTQLPVDPLNNAPYVYTYESVSAGDGFRISVQLENVTDPEAAQSQARCGVTMTQGVYVVCAQ